MDISLIHSSADGYLGCSTFGTIVNPAAMDIHTQVLG